MACQWVVAKFGGTSVSSCENWHNILSMVAQHQSQGAKLMIVCSAMHGVSNQLETAIEAALNKQQVAAIAPIKQKYATLCKSLGLVFDELLATDLQQLEQLLTGIALTHDASPKLKARVMAYGELLLTKLGAQFLINNGITCSWLDARTLLQSNNPIASTNSDYLNAHCHYDQDEELITALTTSPAEVFITQGFVAANQQQETVLLGRGGSDTSAAYLAAKLDATACEIWTDVLGIYTANPNQVPEARLLQHVNYEEAQELASMGAKVLHPKCIGPLKQYRIPLYIKQTAHPERIGTIISQQASDHRLPIKSVITKYNVFLITIETIRMWQQSGFLADVFTIFKKHGVSIDLMSTSESTITLSIDNGHDNQPNQAINAVLLELQQSAQVQLIGPCAAISLVGNQIRTTLHKLGPIFNLFESQKIHLLSQSANDLNLTIVVDTEQAEKLTQRIHHLIIEQHPKRHYLGKSFAEETGQSLPDIQQWWRQQQQSLLTMMQQSEHTSLYVYNKQCVQEAIDRMAQVQAVDRLFYAMKANNNPEILKLIKQSSVNFECVSMNEVKTIFELFPNIDRQRILFTPNFANKEEYAYALAAGAYITIDNLYPLQHWPQLFQGKQIILRVDPGYGAGHHKFVCTGGVESKFGVAIEDIPEIVTITSEQDIEVIGLHIHSGSGIMQADIWLTSATVLLGLIDQFPSIQLINLGGGLGVVEKPGQNPLDLAQLDASLHTVKKTLPNLEIWMEPGRYFVAEAGVLLSRINQIKEKNDMHFVGIDTGMNSLVRPSLYGSYHEIVNLTRLNAPKTQVVNIVGPICESGDTLGYSRLFPESQEGDIILIANAGAYGHTMSSRYNLREPASEYCT